MEKGQLGAHRLVLLFLVLFVASRVTADVTYTVCASGCNFDAVSAAIASAVSGDTTTIDVDEGSYVETSSTNVTATIIFNMNGNVTITTGGGFWLYIIGSSVTISGAGRLTLIGGGIQMSNFGGPLTLSVPLAIVSGAAGFVMSNSDFYQNSDITMDLLLGATGMDLVSGKWHQQGNTYIGCPNVYCRGVYYFNSGLWNQSGDITFRSGSIKLDDAAIRLYYLITWIQGGSIDVDCYNSTAVSVLGSTWNQTGYVTILVGRSGVGLGLNAVWTQQGPVNITVSDYGRAMVLTGTEWNQLGTVDLNLATFGGGVWNHQWIKWTQSADVTITMGESSRGVYFEPANADNNGADFLWEVRGMTVMYVSNLGTGVSNTINGNVTVTTGNLFINAASGAAYAVNYPAKQMCCTNCVGAYNLTWAAGDQISFTLSLIHALNFALGLYHVDVLSLPLPNAHNLAHAFSDSLHLTLALANSFTLTVARYHSLDLAITISSCGQPNTIAFSLDHAGFNYTAPQLDILPRDANGRLDAKAAVRLALEGVAEVASRLDSSPVATAYCINGTWKRTETGRVISGSSQSFTYSCLLAVVYDLERRSTGGSGGDESNLTLEMQLDLFDNSTSLELGDVVNITITPELTKLSLRLGGRWPWHSTYSRLEVRINISPVFTRAVLIDTVNGTTTSSSSSSSSTATATTWRLEGQKSADSGSSRSTTVRLVNVVETDGETRVGDKWIAHGFDDARSAIVMSFAQFTDSLAYDPDIGVVLGRSSGGKSGGSDGDSATLMIIGVAVAIPVACVTVVVAAATAAFVIHYRFRRAPKKLALTRGKSVNFLYDDEL